MPIGPLPEILVNTPAIELWPAWLLRARGNHAARVLAQSLWVMRRKGDGQYLAAGNGVQWHGLHPRWQHQPGMGHALKVKIDACPTASRSYSAALPVHGLQHRLDALGLDADTYAMRTGLTLVAEPVRLHLAGADRYGRPLWLHREAAHAWRAMQAAAMNEGVVLEAISGYRSHDYQFGIFQRKRDRGLSMQTILKVNAAPGFSEHHSGFALDIGTPGEPAAEESFESTIAFAWLNAHATVHGFSMSYPRNNSHGIVYEPWHWRFGAGCSTG